jgi:hypothetical protein
LCDPEKRLCESLAAADVKHLGAIAVQDAVWVLPRTKRTEEQFQWLAAEITELGGESVVWEAEQLTPVDSAKLRRQFVEGVESEYTSILAALKKKGCDLTAVSKQFQQAQARDFFASPLGRQVRERLLAAEGDEP